MRRRCHNCKALLGVWEARCPCCRVSAMRRLHLFAVVVVSLTLVFYLLVTTR
jgi:RNA polymerase subunit RPABC4/transcription elongation factor Spt4